MLARRNRHAFTLIELLTVMAIIVILIGILTPSLTGARNRAIQTAIKAQINAMSVGLESFHGDEGKYPASNAYLWAKNTGTPGPEMDAWEVQGGGNQLQGAHILVDALVGRDFLGYDPKMGTIGSSSGGITYNRWAPTNDRRAPYIPVDGISTTSDAEPPEDALGQIPNAGNRVQPTIDGLQCQVFRDKFGWPILYYRASPTAGQNTPIVQTMNAMQVGDGVYDGSDNGYFTSYNGTNNHRIRDAVNGLPTASYTGNSLIQDDTNGPGHFAEFIRSIRATTYQLNSTNIQIPRPVRSDRFIILSAGKDGLYGTLDDVANFEPFSTER